MRYSVMMIRRAVTPICTRYYGEREAISLRHLYLFLCCHRWRDLADRRKMTRPRNATWRQARHGWMIPRSHTAPWNVIQEILLSVGIERPKTPLPNIISSDWFRSTFRHVGTWTYRPSILTTVAWRYALIFRLLYAEFNVETVSATWKHRPLHCVTVTPCLREMDLPSQRLQRGRSMSLIGGGDRLQCRRALFIVSRHISQKNVERELGPFCTLC